jgi:hypothetical protein
MNASLFYLTIAVVAVLPLLIFQNTIRRLFWFGDDFAFISDIHDLGFAHWFPQIFGENYLPVFKAYWSAIFFLGGASSALAIKANWALHAFNAVLLARFLRLIGFSRLASAAGAIFFGIAAANIELLTWSMGGSTILSCTFLLLALVSEATPSASLWPKTFRTTGWILAGTLAHARGVAVGPAFALFALLDTAATSSVKMRGIRAFLFFLPSLVVGGTIALFSPNDHSAVLSGGNMMLSSLAFSGWYLAGNPFIPLVFVSGHTWTFVNFNTLELAALGLLKLAIAISAIKSSSGKTRAFATALIAIELVTAALMGLGRGEGDAVLSMSPRYQYGSLICTLPLLFIAGAGLVEKFAWLRKFSRAATLISVVTIVVLNLVLWKNILPPWVKWRGEGTRKVIYGQANPQGKDLPGAPFMTNERARELKKFFDLN